MRVVSFDLRIACDHCGSVGTLPHTAVNHLVQCSKCGETFSAKPNKGQEPAGEPKVNPAGKAPPPAREEFQMIFTCGSKRTRFLLTFTRSCPSQLYQLEESKRLWLRSDGDQTRTSVGNDGVKVLRKELDYFECPGCGMERFGIRVHNQSEGCGGAFCEGGLWSYGGYCGPDPHYGYITRSRRHCPICNVESVWVTVEKNGTTAVSVATIGQPPKVTGVELIGYPELPAARSRQARVSPHTPVGLMAPFRRLFGGKA